MNIKEFLAENYIYIIIVIVLTIVTIIGFLADKKKNNEKKPKTMGGTISNQQINNGENMNYQPNNQYSQPINFQPINNNMQPNNPVNTTVPNNMTSILGVQDNSQMNMQNIQPINPVPQMNQVQDNQNNNMMNNQPIINNVPQPVEQLNQNIPQPEMMYQPLSEQQPMTAPTLPSFNNNMINNQEMTNNFNNKMNSLPTTPNVIPTMPMEEQQVSVLPMPNQMPQPMNQPVEPIPNQVGNTIPNQITTPQPVTPQPVNFVYGGVNQNQGNNNQYM